MADGVKYCRQCGKQLNIDAKFCRYCGYQFEVAQEVKAAKKTRRVRNSAVTVVRDWVKQD